MSLRDDINAAHEKYKAKAFIEAEIAIRNLLAQHPSDKDALRLGALTALALNQVIAAQSRMAQACQDVQMNAEIQNTWGNIYKASEEWAQAEAAYKEAMALDPNYEPARHNFIDLLVSSGQPDRAAIEIESQLQTHGNSNFLREAKVMAFTELGQYAQAWDIAEEIDGDYRRDKMAYLKVRLLFYARRYDEMKDLADTISPSSEYKVAALKIVTNAYAMSGDMAAMKEFISAATDDAQALPIIYTTSIQRLRRAGFNVMADDIARKAQVKFGHKSAAIMEGAEALKRKGDYRGAAQNYAQALSMSPGNLSIMLEYAQLCLLAGEYDTCQNLIHAALQQAPNNQFVIALAATLHRLRGGPYEILYDFDKYIQSYELATPKGYNTIMDFNAALKARLEHYHEFQSAPLDQSLRGGIQTNMDLSFIDDPILKQFFAMIDAPIKAYMAHIGYDSAHPLLRRNTGGYRFNGAWSVKLSSEGHHVNHVHPKGWISSSYYVDVPDVTNNHENQEGWIKFGEPNMKSLDLPAEKFLQPRSGRLVLFPSYMWHGTVPFSGNQSRLTLPFDVVPA